MVLIDTWWNVNAGVLTIGYGHTGFNRYMVECEYAHLALCNKQHRVLIDTWWNVNSECTAANFSSSLVLIDTWWNVNPLALLKCLQSGESFNRYMVECE